MLQFTISCNPCGHELNVSVHEDEVDSLPTECENCGSTNMVILEA